MLQGYQVKSWIEQKSANSTVVTALTGGFSSMENGVKYTFGVEAVNAHGSGERVTTTFVAGAPTA